MKFLLIHILLLTFLLTSCMENPESIPEQQEVESCIEQYLNSNKLLDLMEIKIDTLVMGIDTTITQVYVIRESYPDGGVKTISEYKDCVKKGLEKEFYRNGQLRSERTVVEQQVWWSHKYYSQSGDSLYPGDVSWGKGTLYDYYDNGSIYSISKVKNGLPDSCRVFYFKTGEIHSKVNYINENRDDYIYWGVGSPMIFYRKSGSIEKVYEIEHGKITYVKEYDEIGNIVNEYSTDVLLNN